MTFTRERWGRVETCWAIDALAFFAAIRPHLDGEWTVVDTHTDDTETSVKRVRGLVAERTGDGVRLSIYPEWRDSGTKVRVTTATHYYGASRDYNDSISDSYLYHDGTPLAVIDVTKRNAKSIAHDIARRVVAPAAAVMPKIRALQDERAAAVERQRDAEGIARNVPGVLVREHYSDKSVTLIEFSGTYTHATIRRGSTDFHVERLYLPVEALAEFAALVIKYKAGT